MQLRTWSGVAAMLVGGWGCQAQAVPPDMAACSQFMAIASSYASSHPEQSWSAQALVRGQTASDEQPVTKALAPLGAQLRCHARITQGSGQTAITYLVVQLHDDEHAQQLETALHQDKRWSAVYRDQSKLFAIASDGAAPQPELIKAGQTAIDYVPKH